MCVVVWVLFWREYLKIIKNSIKKFPENSELTKVTNG